jgi:hypothetical protein
VISRQKLIGWILVVVAGAFLIHFVRTRLLVPGLALDRKEWMQFIGYVVVLVIGTVNVRMASLRQGKR